MYLCTFRMKHVWLDDIGLCKGDKPRFVDSDDHSPWETAVDIVEDPVGFVIELNERVLALKRYAATGIEPEEFSNRWNAHRCHLLCAQPMDDYQARRFADIQIESEELNQGEI